MRYLNVAGVCILLHCSVWSQITLSISASKELQPNISGSGRMLVYFYKGDKPDPINSIEPDDPKGSGFRFGQDVNWKGNQPVELSKQLIGFPLRSLNNLEAGDYNVQVIYDIDTISYHLFAAPNFYSVSKKIHVTKKGKETFTLQLDKQFPVTEYNDGKYIKFISIKSDLLSKFWKRDIILHAAVMVPQNFDSTGTKKYPVVYNIGGYGSSCKEFLRYESGPGYLKFWTSKETPEMLNVLLDSDAPYGDSYQMNSENNGPYMDALVNELIPVIEKKFHANGTPESRFLTGGSTGGWVSLALQIFNPDFFNGCWSFYGDPVDFNFYQLINIYKDENAFINRFGNLNPSMRTVYGEPILIIKDEVSYENVLGRNNSYVFSGDQWGGWNAVYSPKGKDGRPQAIWDPVTGKIDTAVANSWKKWDLRLYLKTNWQIIGPKLQGKLHIWMGDMDTYYLNNAMRLFQDFINKTENPKSDAQITFGPMKIHGWQPITNLELLQQMQKQFEASKKGF